MKQYFTRFVGLLCLAVCLQLNTNSLHAQCDVTLSTANGDFPWGQLTQWTVPANVTEITVTVRGAEGYFGGQGATAQSTLPVIPGHVLNVIVGDVGSGYGGGGTGIYDVTSGTVLIVAGGGGAGGFAGGQGGRATENGGDGVAPGGTNGNGGSGDAGGGGAFSAGSGGNGGIGGEAGVPDGGNSIGYGFGFGGGGFGGLDFPGGGGGYSGGGTGSEFTPAGGGGSFVHPSGTNTTITAGMDANGSNNGLLRGYAIICIPSAAQCDLAIDNISSTPESCPGAGDGAITVTASCTTCSSIEYSIDGMNFQVGNAFTGVAPDTYTLTVRDAGDATCTATAEATVAGGPDTDSDGDGTVDCNDGCPYDPNKVAPGDCGCGVPDTDTDGDGVADCNDNCIYTANPGQEDTDNDGIGDACDECPTDPDKFEAGICGCFVPETDCIDACAAFNALVNNVMEDDTDANNGQKNSLITKLHRAKLQFEEGDNNNAVNMLNAFINQVQALSGGNNKPIPQAIADDWVAIAQNLIDNISNNSAVCVQALISGSNPTNTTASADYTSMPDLTTEPNAGQKDILMLEASPNPFANDVSLQIDLPEAGKVNLSIFNLQGQRVITLIDRTLDTGQHRMEWDGYSQAGKALPAGVYLVQLQTENDLINLQLVLMK